MDIKILNVKGSTRDAILREISVFAEKNGISKNAETTLEEFIKREELGTTGFEDGIAIPHARNDDIIKSAVIIARSVNGVNWPALDNKKTTTMVSLLIQGGASAGSEHMDTLATISQLLLDDENKKVFRSGTEAQVINLIKKQQKPNVAKKIEKGFNIVGVSACATGVAHTFMAQKALLNAGEELKYNVRVETQGQKGQESTLTDQEIKDADLVIIAADINVELDRFNGKKVFLASTNDAIKDAKALIKKAQENAILRSGEASQTLSAGNSGGIMKHILSGVSRMIPFIVFSGIVWAILEAVIQGGAKGEAIELASKAAQIGFTFFIAMMGGFIGESIAGRAALAPAAISTFAASNADFWWNWNGAIPKVNMLDTHGAEILNKDGNPITLAVGWTIVGAIVCGFAAGHLVKWMNTWKVPSVMSAMMPIIVIPVIATSAILFPIVFVLGAPVGYIINNIGLGIGIAGQITGLSFLIGFILGGMIGFDMGGPVNKIAGATSTALILVDPRLLGAVEAAIPIAPLGCGLATIIGGKLFDKTEKGLGLTALALGFFGISEGAIPFAAKRPKLTIVANMVASALAGGLAFLFFVGGHVGMWGGPIVALVLGVYADPGSLGVHIPDVFGGSSRYLSILWFFVAIAAGMIAHAFIYIYVIRRDNAGKGIFFKSKENNPIARFIANSKVKAYELETKALHKR